MAIIGLYSKRQKAVRGEVPDVYTYDSLPEKLIVQIIYIWWDVLGNSEDYHSYGNRGKSVRHAYQSIVNLLRREYGVFQLNSEEALQEEAFIDELSNFLLGVKDVEKELDVIELSFRYVDKIIRRDSYLDKRHYSTAIDDAIDELNTRFKEHGIGFQFEEGEIIRVDSELIHSEAVKPALRLLNEQNFQGAQQEFLGAYEHYRHGKHKEALNDCLKSFESTMKAICDKRNWVYPKNATAKKLIGICFERDLVPDYWQNQLRSLQNLLESTIPTGRNKLSGHGQGANVTSVPDYLVAYMLHMTASTLVFLTKAEKEIA